MAKKRGVVARVVRGAVAGAAATWIMNRVTAYLYGHESRAARRSEGRARRGSSAYTVAAEKAAGLVGAKLSRADRDRYGTAVHWGVGIATGVVYGALRDRLPLPALARGLAFGMAFWLCVDEGAVYALHLTPGLRRFPWQTHARRLAGHVVYGTALDAALGITGPRTA